MMLYKDGVVHVGLNWRMRKVAKIVEEIWTLHGQDAVMTSGMDGKHSEGSWHYYGCASDFRTRYFSKEEAAAVATELSAALGNPYQVVLHPDSHIHVEFDPVAFGMG